ncbi:hypothetical protein BCR42DRAFT_201562 [Absidia repens]|uniref:Uncharacterized protein n=1 Tax=Absidia repens TaxID=90262 RepID=A0A1X2HL18_9FUNG|nr:hypothetical protein BCR42DRAFT_201562 [Absidia repens]
MVPTLQLYQKHAPLPENKKPFIAISGSIGFLKNILKNIKNCKFTGISPPLDVYKSLIKHAYGATCGNQIIKYLQTDVDQISPFLLKKLKKEHEQAQAQQPEIILECSVTNANDDMDWSRTFGDQDDYMDESDSSLSTNTIDEPFLDFSQLILAFMNQQHQFSKTQQSQVYLFLEAFTPMKGSGPSNNAAQNNNAFSIKNSLLSDLAQNKKLLPEKEPEIKDNVATLSYAESITRKRQRHQKPQPLVKRQRKDGETTAFPLCKETLSEHPPTSIAQSCKPPCDPRASGQQNKRKRDHQTLEPQQKRQRNGGQTGSSLGKKSLSERPLNILCNLNGTRQQQNNKRKKDHQSFEPPQKRQNQAQKENIAPNMITKKIVQTVH